MPDFTIDDLLLKAREVGASDLHITVGLMPKVRINGQLYDMQYPKLTPSMTHALIEPILSPANKYEMQENGEVDFSYAIQGVSRFRINAFMQRGSYACAIRIVSVEIPRVEQLLLPQSVIDLVHKKRGLVLVTGPTGSGKSTTLASLLDLINKNRSAHIITLEDPIEYLHNHQRSIVNQREIGLDTKSFAQALRAALREDPDVVLVGEMRDLDTIATALTAAETGHLVFSTLHTTGAAKTVDRILDVFSNERQHQIRVQLANVLESVISQQLVPTKDKRSRVAAFEVLHNNAAVANLIREGKTHQIDSLIQMSRKLGMQSMDDSLYRLALDGKIMPRDAVEYALDADTMQKRLIGGQNA